MIEVGFVVEGHGDSKAVPVVFRRIAEVEFPNLGIIDRVVFRVSRDKLKGPGEVERVVEFIARRFQKPGAILIVIDSEGERPGCLGPLLLERARQARKDVPLGVVVAHHMFESWLIAAGKSLAGYRGLREDMDDHPDPESAHGAKSWLSDRMIGRSYREATDQEPLTRRFDIDRARRCRSFDKLWREVVRLCREAGQAVSRPAS